MAQTDDKSAPAGDAAVAEKVDPLKWMEKFSDDEEVARGELVWEVEGLDHSENKIYSSDVIIDGDPWRLMAFPRGNRVNQHSEFSLFIERKDKEKAPRGWQKFVQFQIRAISSTGEHFAKEADHRFTVAECDWGFSKFMLHTDLLMKSKGFLNSGKFRFEATVRVLKGTSLLWGAYSTWDSRRETGFVGLQNQGATCYMNSLLQTLYMTGAFRKLVYNMPVTSAKEDKLNVALALQRVFYELQNADDSVSTTQLTKSFGWASIDAFMQHDVEELSRVLIDNIEAKLKGTEQEKAISQLFQGHFYNYIRCVNVEYTSSREEAFYDIQLNVKGMKTLERAFEDYVQEETMDGENQYDAGEHGKQDAKKGVCFKQLPPILHLHLKRFDYDWNNDAQVKINDRLEFPEEINLDRFLKESDPDHPADYSLHAVLVHAGDVHGGHYVVFLRPGAPGSEKGNTWLKFDDDRVSRARKEDAIDGNFGVDPEPENGAATTNMTGGLRTYSVAPRLSRRVSNAYMLVYYRKETIAECMPYPSGEDIPEEVRERFTLELQNHENMLREREQEQFFTRVHVLTDEQAKLHTGFDLFDATSVNSNKPANWTGHNIRIKRDATIADLKAEIATLTQVPVDQQRLWSFVGRENGTTRPETLLDKDTDSIESVSSTMGDERAFAVYAELGTRDESSGGGGGGGGGLPPLQPLNPKAEALLFYKQYDPATGTMRFAGRCVVNLHDRLSSMVPRVQENLPGLGKHYVVYEEIKPTMVEPIEMNLTTVKAELGSGDILVFQNELAAGVQRETLELPDVIAYFNFVMNRIRVEFRAIDKYKEPGFEIDLGTNMSYTVWTEKCAAHLNADPAYMRFTGHMTTTEGPRENPIRLSESPTLSVAAGHYVSVHTVHRQSAAVRRIIYYEILPSPLAEMETKTSLTVIHVDASLMEKARIKVVVPQNGKFADVLEELEKTIKKSEGGTGQLRVLLVQNYSIRTEMKPEDSVGSSYTYSYLQIQVEEVPQEELDMEEGDKRVEVRHFAKDIYRLHGRPFYQVIKQGETVGSVKERLRKRLNVSEKEWTKYKLARVVYASATYLEDDEEVLIREGIKCDVLGIDHADKSRTYKSSYERPLMIHN